MTIIELELWNSDHWMMVQSFATLIEALASMRDNERELPGIRRRVAINLYQTGFSDPTHTLALYPDGTYSEDHFGNSSHNGVDFP